MLKTENTPLSYVFTAILIYLYCFLMSSWTEKRPVCNINKSKKSGTSVKMADGIMHCCKYLLENGIIYTDLTVQTFGLKIRHYPE
ncbi:hypothetical protein CSTERTH_04005 [Thermoclostridium stercorarium subsp. thermolacticum DSM 2910]|uniref:Uncharacterized protein n=1 Tax=Thermoclostridium stercorarium subsp. thermolacticum DSM 2910 TaxID=1121336 RepID=A0A1B1YBV4_THEST|nr:hypothetical protein CSTERTH_04005 [Thermoclostridium stercorarium subsp. thermolacticum DSM 2910]